jgi:MFS family permease
MRKISETYKKSPIKKERRGIRPIHMIILSWLLVELVLLYVIHNYILVYDDPSEEIEGSTSSLFIVITMVYVTYMFPSIIGRNRSNRWTIFMLNFFLGWTVLGWLGAFFASLGRDNGRK